MPYQFTGFEKSYVAKAGVVADGDTFLVSGTDGYTLTSTLSSYSLFTANPVRSDVGVWSVTLKDPAVQSLLEFDVQTVTAAGEYLGVQKNVPTRDSRNRLVLHWTFNNAGTPADFSTGDGVQQFVVYVVYTESSLK